MRPDCSLSYHLDAAIASRTPIILWDGTIVPGAVMSLKSQNVAMVKLKMHAASVHRKEKVRRNNI